MGNVDNFLGNTNKDKEFHAKEKDHKAQVTKDVRKFLPGKDKGRGNVEEEHKGQEGRQSNVALEKRRKRDDDMEEDRKGKKNGKGENGQDSDEENDIKEL